MNILNNKIFHPSRNLCATQQTGKKKKCPMKVWTEVVFEKKGDMSRNCEVSGDI